VLCSPLHKVPVELNRYDNEPSADSFSYAHPRHYKSPSKVRGKARALYHFRAQSQRSVDTILFFSTAVVVYFVLYCNYLCQVGYVIVGIYLFIYFLSVCQQDYAKSYK